MSFLNEIKKLLNEVIAETDGLGAYIPGISDEESEDENSSDVDTQELNYVTLDKVSGDIVKKFKNAIAEGQKLEGESLQKTLAEPMGIIKANHITEIQKVAVTTSKGRFIVKPLDVMSVESNDKDKEKKNTKTSGPKNYAKYANFQIIPFTLMNDKDEIVAGGKGDEEYIAVFIVPALFSIISEDNIPKHEALFNFSAEKDKKFYHSNLIKARFFMFAKNELADLAQSFRAGNFAKIKSPMLQQAKRKPTNRNEQPGQDNQ